MSGLEIHPHSRRITHLAIVVLTLSAASGFAAGVVRQLGPAGAAPFPTNSSSSIAAIGGIPNAIPARPIEVAAAAPRPVHPAEAVTAPDEVPTDEASAAAPSPPVSDASASTPDAPAPAPAAQPAPSADPSSPPDPPTP